MQKENVVQPHNGILCSLKKEWQSDTCYSVGEPRGHWAKCAKPVTKGQMLYDSTCVRSPNSVRLIERRMAVAEGGGRGTWDSLVNGYGVLVLQVHKVPEVCRTARDCTYHY